MKPKRLMWVNDHSLYDLRTHTIVKPKVFDIVQILQQFKDLPKDQQPARIETVSLILIVQKKQEIFRIVELIIQGGKTDDKNLAMLFQQFQSMIRTPSAEEYLKTITLDMVKQLIRTYLQDEHQQQLQSVLSIIKAIEQISKSKFGIQEQKELPKEVITIESNQLNQQNQKVEIDIDQFLTVPSPRSKSSQSLEVMRDIYLVKGNQNKGFEFTNGQKQLKKITDQYYAKDPQVSEQQCAGEIQDKNKNDFETLHPIDDDLQLSISLNLRDSPINSNFDNDHSENKSRSEPNDEIKSNQIELELEKASEVVTISSDSEKQTIDEGYQRTYCLTQETTLYDVYVGISQLNIKSDWWYQIDQECKAAGTDKELQTQLSKIAPILIQRWMDSREVESTPQFQFHQDQEPEIHIGQQDPASQQIQVKPIEDQKLIPQNPNSEVNQARHKNTKTVMTEDTDYGAVNQPLQFESSMSQDSLDEVIIDEKQTKLSQIQKESKSQRISNKSQPQEQSTKQDMITKLKSLNQRKEFNLDINIVLHEESNMNAPFEDLLMILFNALKLAVPKGQFTIHQVLDNKQSSQIFEYKENGKILEHRIEKHPQMITASIFILCHAIKYIMNKAFGITCMTLISNIAKFLIDKLSEQDPINLIHMNPEDIEESNQIVNSLKQKVQDIEQKGQVDNKKKRSKKQPQKQQEPQLTELEQKQKDEIMYLKEQIAQIYQMLQQNNKKDDSNSREEKEEPKKSRSQKKKEQELLRQQSKEREQKRQAELEKERKDQERKEQERLEQERKEQERIQKEKKQQERREQQEKKEQERKAFEKKQEAERLEKEKEIERQKQLQEQQKREQREREEKMKQEAYDKARELMMIQRKTETEQHQHMTSQQYEPIRKKPQNAYEQPLIGKKNKHEKYRQKIPKDPYQQYMPPHDMYAPPYQVPYYQAPPYQPRQFNEPWSMYPVPPPQVEKQPDDKMEKIFALLQEMAANKKLN